MAGLGSRFTKKGYDKPKPFIDVDGVPMIVQVLKNLSIPDAKFYLIARVEHLLKEPQIVSSIERNFNVKFIEINKLTEGSACTVLYARKFINNNDHLLIANSDQIVDMNIQDFINDCLERQLDGSILCFRDKERNPKWSFAEIDESGILKRVKEKEAISEYATVGVYFYRKGSDFVNAALDMFVENDRVNNEFYTCPTYNYLIRDNKRVGIFEILPDQMHGIGTPDDLRLYLSKIKRN